MDNTAFAGSSGLRHSGLPVCLAVRRRSFQIHSPPIAMPRKASPPRTAPIILTRGVLPWLEDKIGAVDDEVSDEVSDSVIDGIEVAR